MTDRGDQVGFYVEAVVLGHHRFRVAGPAACWLWVQCGVWSVDAGREGFVDLLTVKAYGTLAQARKLVEVGLWEEVEDGFRFLRWRNGRPGLDSAPEALALKRRSGALRQALYRNPALREAIRVRDQDRCRYCGRTVNWRDLRGVLSGTFDHVDPKQGNTLENLVVCCRSDNTRKGRRTPEEAGMHLLDVPVTPVTVTGTSPDVTAASHADTDPLDTLLLSEVPPLSPPQGESDRAPRRSRARATPYPKGFEAKPGHRTYAAEHHLDVEAELGRFRDHALMNGRIGVDWDAGFRNWLKIGAEKRAAAVPAQRPQQAERPLRKFT